MYLYLFLLLSLNSPVEGEGEWGGRVLPITAFSEGYARKGYLFQASGILKSRDFTS